MDRNRLQGAIELAYHFKMAKHAIQMRKSYALYIIWFLLALAVMGGIIYFCGFETGAAIAFIIFTANFVQIPKLDLDLLRNTIAHQQNIFAIIPKMTWVYLYFFLYGWSSLVSQFGQFAFVYCVPVMLIAAMAGYKFQDFYPNARNMHVINAHLEECLKQLDEEKTYNELTKKTYLPLHYGCVSDEYLYIKNLPQAFTQWRKLTLKECDILLSQYISTKKLA